MTVTDVVRDRANRTLTFVAEYPAAPAQVWQLWADPRLLERWWGPPSHLQPLSSTTCGRAARSRTS